MSIRFRKSIGLGRGVRFNVNKGSVGLSFGVPGLRYSFNSSGRSYRSIGIPGTGLYSVTQTSGGSHRRRASTRRGSSGSNGSGNESDNGVTVTPEMAESVIPKPGWFASGTEKRFREGVVAYLQHEWEPAAHSFAQAVEGDSRNLSDDFFLAATLTRLHRFTDAIPVMERVVASNQPLPDGLMQKYVPGTLEMQLPVTEHVTVGAGFDSIGASLILAELYQEVGRLEDAIGVVQRLHRLMPDEPTIRLSLADLLFSDDDFKGLIELTQDVENESTVELAMLHLRARALENDGLIGPAIEQLTACLRRTANRDPELLKAIRYDRAEAFERTGNERRAKSDWTKLVAEDPFYRDARSRLEALASPSSA